MEPNVGIPRISSAHLGFPNAPDISFNSNEFKAHFRALKEVFEETMGEDLSSKEIAEMAMA